MDNINQKTIPVRVARLIIEFLHNDLSHTDELDQWMGESDQELEIFSFLTDNLDDHVFDPNKLIIETETVIDLWIIAGLIVRQHRGLNNEFEEYYLNHWVYADQQNWQLYKDLQHPAFMQKMLVWNRLKRESGSL